MIHCLRRMVILFPRLRTWVCIVQSLSTPTSSNGVAFGEPASFVTDGKPTFWGKLPCADENRASIAYGHPYMIDVQDCDARLPSSGDLSDLYLDELVRLSIILGRVQKTIYT